MLDKDFGYVSNLAVVGLNFFTAIKYFAVGIQGAEMYPTCLRQTGFALCAIGANLSGTISPYIAYLVSTHTQYIFLSNRISRVQIPVIRFFCHSRAKKSIQDFHW